MSLLYKPNSLGIIFIILHLHLHPLSAEKCANPQHLTASKHEAIIKSQVLTQMKITCWSEDLQVQQTLFYDNDVFKCANENRTVTLTGNLQTLFNTYLNYTQDGISLTVTPSRQPWLQYKYNGYALKDGKVYYYQDEKILYNTNVYRYVLSTDPPVQYAIFLTAPKYDSYIGLRLMPEQELDDELNVTFWRTDIENVTIYYYALSTEKRYHQHHYQLFTKLQNLSTGFPYSYFSTSGPLVLPLHYLYIQMRYACFLQLIEDSQYQTTTDYEILLYLTLILLFAPLLNIFINYLTLRKFQNFKWYTLRWLSNGLTLRYVVDSLRSENETQYEQIYLFIKNLKGQEKNIFIVKRDTNYGYDYARVSKQFLRSMRIYENLPSSSNSDPLLTDIDSSREGDSIG